MARTGDERGQSGDGEDRTRVGEDVTVTVSGSTARRSAKRDLGGGAQAAYEAIRQRIVDGEYYPSQRLVEAQLAQSLGFSRHNVRTALDRLHTDGLVRIAPNRGATVATLTLEEALDILRAREALEAEAARMAAQRITDEQLAELAEHVATMTKALAASEWDRYSATNVLFHEKVYQASGSRTIPDLIKTLRLRLARLQLRTILIPGRSEGSLSEHVAIYEALRARDPAAAAEAARGHVSSLSRAVENAWSLVRL